MASRFMAWLHRLLKRMSGFRARRTNEFIRVHIYQQAHILTNEYEDYRQEPESIEATTLRTRIRGYLEILYWIERHDDAIVGAVVALGKRLGFMQRRTQQQPGVESDRTVVASETVPTPSECAAVSGLMSSYEDVFDLLKRRGPRVDRQIADTSWQIARAVGSGTPPATALKALRSSLENSRSGA